MDLLFSQGQLAATALVDAVIAVGFLGSELWLADQHFVTTAGAFCSQVRPQSVSRAFASLAH